MIKKLFWGCCISLGAIALTITLTSMMTVASWAVPIEEVPNPRQVDGGWVADVAEILSPASEAEINGMISALEAENGSEMAVVTVPETEPLTPKAFATELFNRWGIGKQGEDNGVLFLVSVGDRRMEVEAGYGAEAVLPDARVGRILDQYVVPEFRQGDYEQGILQGTEAIVAAMRSGDFDAVASTPATNRGYLPILALGSGMVAIATFVITRLRGRTTFITPQGYTRYGQGYLNSTGIFLSGSVVIVAIGIGIFLFVTSVVLFSIFLVLCFTFYPFLVEILKTIRYRQRSQHSCFCETCKQPMQKLADEALSDRLVDPEKVAQQLNSVHYEGWHCPRCYPEPLKLPMSRRVRQAPPPDFHLFAHAESGSFATCPTCQELTMVGQSDIVERPTTYRQGRRRIIYDCRSCSYHTERQELIPKLTRTYYTGSHSSGRGFSSGSSSGRSGGSFGGGRSGGGGSGRGW